jgi:hypothetical protein
LGQPNTFPAAARDRRGATHARPDGCTARLAQGR